MDILLFYFLAMLGSNRKIMITDVAMLIISLIYIPFMLSHLLFYKTFRFWKYIGLARVSRCVYD